SRSSSTTLAARLGPTAGGVTGLRSGRQLGHQPVRVAAGPGLAPEGRPEDTERVLVAQALVELSAAVAEVDVVAAGLVPGGRGKDVCRGAVGACTAGQDYSNVGTEMLGQVRRLKRGDPPGPVAGGAAVPAGGPGRGAHPGRRRTEAAPAETLTGDAAQAGE